MKKLVVFKIEGWNAGGYVVHYRNMHTGGSEHNMHVFAIDELDAFKKVKDNWEQWFSQKVGMVQRGWTVELGGESESSEV